MPAIDVCSGGRARIAGFLPGEQLVQAPDQRKGTPEVPTEPVLYEAMYIIDAALEEAQVAEVVSAFEAAVVEAGGEVKNSLPFGRKRLAYEIKGHAEGLYMITYFETDKQNAVQLLTREAAMIEPIVRFVICVANPGAIFTGQVKAPVVEATAAEGVEGVVPVVDETPGAEPDVAGAADTPAEEPDAEQPETDDAAKAEEPETEQAETDAAAEAEEPETEQAETDAAAEGENAEQADEGDQS